jgi:RIO-like serine/threonine protein kinase
MNNRHNATQHSMNQKQEAFANLVKSGFTVLQATELIDMIYEIVSFDVSERTEKLMAAGFNEEQAKVLVEMTYRAKGWKLSDHP